MAQIQSRHHPPPNAGGVTEAAPRDGARCACGQMAMTRFRNVWRSRDACTQMECRERARAWVGNTPMNRMKGPPKPMLPVPPGMQIDVGEFMSRDMGPRPSPPGPRPPGPKGPGAQPQPRSPGWRTSRS